MDPITIATAAATYVPKLFKFFKERHENKDVANKVVEVVKEVAGTDDSEEALKAIEANPELQVKLQESMNHVLVEAYEAEAEQIKTINSTMVAEITGKGIFKTGWRPFFGWVCGATFAIQMLSAVILVGLAIYQDPVKAHITINAIASMFGAMMAMWSVALGVLGINISKRSQDKLVAAGKSPAIGLLQKITSKIIK